MEWQISLNELASKGRNVYRDVYRKLAPKSFTRIKSNRSNLVEKRKLRSSNDQPLLAPGSSRLFHERRARKKSLSGLSPVFHCKPYIVTIVSLIQDRSRPFAHHLAKPVHTLCRSRLVYEQRTAEQGELLNSNVSHVQRVDANVRLYRIISRRNNYSPERLAPIERSTKIADFSVTLFTRSITITLILREC